MRYALIVLLLASSVGADSMFVPITPPEPKVDTLKWSCPACGHCIPKTVSKWTTLMGCMKYPCCNTTTEGFECLQTGLQFEKKHPECGVMIVWGRLRQICRVDTTWKRLKDWQTGKITEIDTVTRMNWGKSAIFRCDTIYTDDPRCEKKKEQYPYLKGILPTIEQPGDPDTLYGARKVNVGPSNPDRWPMCNVTIYTYDSSAPDYKRYLPLIEITVQDSLGRDVGLTFSDIDGKAAFVLNRGRYTVKCFGPPYSFEPQKFVVIGDRDKWWVYGSKKSDRCSLAVAMVERQQRIITLLTNGDHTADHIWITESSTLCPICSEIVGLRRSQSKDSAKFWEK